VSLSQQARHDDIRRVLELMLAQIGGQAIDRVLFNRDEPPFDEIYPTTWKELAEEYLIKSLDGVGLQLFRLTGHGWYTALEQSNCLSDPTLIEKMSTLSAALKDSVKGRDTEALLYVGTLASQCGLSEDWIFNAIESDLLERHFGRRGAKWADIKNMIVVPIDFGLEPL